MYNDFFYLKMLIQTLSEHMELLIYVGTLLVTILTIIFNPRLSKKISTLKYSLEKTFNNHVLSTNNKFSFIENKINDFLCECKNIKDNLDNHNNFIECYVEEKEMIKCLDNIVTEALKYTKDGTDINNYTAYVGRILLDFFKELLDLGVEGFNEESLILKIKNEQKKVYCLENNIINNTYLKMLKDKRQKRRITYRFIQDLLDISNDEINSKTSRLRVICEGFLQTMMRDIVVTWNEYKSLN